MSQKKIGTHSGQFHADDALACLMLVKYTAEFRSAEIIRTRDQALLKTLDLVVDVGGEYNPETHRYDHHQFSFKETFGEGFKTKLAGSGLIYKHFGPEILRNALLVVFEKDPNFAQYKCELSDQQVKELQETLYVNFFEYFDAIDNGINQYPKDVKPAFKSS